MKITKQWALKDINWMNVNDRSQNQLVIQKLETAEKMFLTFSVRFLAYFFLVCLIYFLHPKKNGLVVVNSFSDNSRTDPVGLPFKKFIKDHEKRTPIHYNLQLCVSCDFSGIFFWPFSFSSLFYPLLFLTIFFLR
jgi:hypothetical protein